MPLENSFSVKNQWDLDMVHWTRVSSDYLSSAGSIAKAVSSTWTWGVSTDFGLSFGELQGSIGRNYSESLTISETYTVNINSGESACIVYTPRYRFFAGSLTTTDGDDVIPVPSGNPAIRTPIRTIRDHVDYSFWVPIPGGHYRLEYSRPTFYKDPLFEGEYKILDTGGHDWKDFNPHLMGSVTVPNGFSVQLFQDTHFRGNSFTFGPGRHSQINVPSIYSIMVSSR